MNTSSALFGSYNWPRTAGGVAVSQSCSNKPSHRAKQHCSREGAWIATDFSECRNSKKTLILVFEIFS